MKDGEKLERARLRRIRAFAHALADVAAAYDKLDPTATHHVANTALLQAMHELCAELRGELEMLQAGE